MTGGRVVVLGKTGKNFAAGMSGGIAYVLDEDNDLYMRTNKSMVFTEEVTNKYDVLELKEMIKEHVTLTNSEKGKEILDNFSEYLPKFKKVIPYDYNRMQLAIVQMEEKGLKARSEGESFLRDNGKRPGIITTASGLQYEILEEGNGKHPKATDSVKCHYEGRLIDGTVFDSSIRRGEPAVFPLNGVISGWTEGVQLMAEGAKYRFYIPYQLAYGANGAGSSIPPYAALIFDIELIAVM